MLLQIFSHLQLISLGLITILNLSLGLYVFFKSPRCLVNRIFLCLAISITLWCLAYFFNNYYYSNVVMFDFFERTTFISGMLISLFFYMFATSYPYNNAIRSKPLIWGYILLIIIATYITIFTNHFVQGTDIINGITTTHHNGSVYVLYAVILAAPFVLGMMSLWKKLRQSDGLYRSHLLTLFVLIGIAISLIFFVDVLLLGLELYKYSGVGPYFSLLFIFAIMRMILTKE